MTTHLLFADVSDDPLFLNTLKPGLLYLPFLIVLLIFNFLCLVNILRSISTTRSELPRRQLITMAIATLIALLTVPAALMAAVFGIPVPRLIYTLLLMVSVALIGYGVARYSALIEGRTIRRDFVYSALATGFIVAIYFVVTWVSVRVFDVPPAAFVFVIILIIVTHNMVDSTRHTLDSIFFRKESRQIRANLRMLANRIGEEDLEANVTFALAAMCNSVRATYGLVILFDGNQQKVAARFNFLSEDISQDVDKFLVDDIIHLEPQQFPPPLDDAALLVPLYFDTDQIGVLIFGQPGNSTNYSREDIELLLYPSDRLAEVISNARRESEHIRQLSQYVERKEQPEQIPTREVEQALRNIYDYAYLGDSPLADLNLIDTRLSEEGVTHIDRGKVVNRVLGEAVEKLKPDTEIKSDPPAREWYPYLILYGSYIENKLNRDIMSYLYVSEGTFNRTRRAAIRSVTRILGEMEAATYH